MYKIIQLHLLNYINKPQIKLYTNSKMYEEKIQIKYKIKNTHVSYKNHRKYLHSNKLYREKIHVTSMQQQQHISIKTD